MQLTEYTMEKEALFNMAFVHQITGGNPVFMKDLASIFVKTIPANAAEMKAACINGDYDAMGKIAHKIKPTIDSMQMVSIKQDIRTIEQNGKAGICSPETEQMVYKVEEVINKVAEQLSIQFEL